MPNAGPEASAGVVHEAGIFREDMSRATAPENGLPLPIIQRGMEGEQEMEKAWVASIG